MGTEDAFLHDILAHPDDDVPRLIYADWLDERNDPRGEFIRIQCALSRLSDEDPRRWTLEMRERELLRDHHATWLPKDAAGLKCDFRRGFVERVEMTPEQFLSAADRIFEQAPIRHLHMRATQRIGRAPETQTDDNAWLSKVALSRHLARLEGLTLTDLTLNQRDIQALLQSPYLREQLTELHLSRLRVEVGWSYHTDFPDYPRLKHLEISDMPLPAGMIRALAEVLFLDELISLDLANTSLSIEDLRALAYSSSLTNLRELNLSGNRLTHEASRILSEGSFLSQLETLHLGSNLLGDAGALVIGEWPPLPRLTRLNLRSNQIFATGIKALA